MAAIFPPKANVIGRAVLLAVAVLFAAGIGWWWLSPRTDWARRVGFAIDQPVPFSHEHHVAGLGIDCRFCHVSVEVSANAGLPPTWTCMTCHSQIWTNAALLAPVRESLAEGKPLAWDRSTTCLITSTSIIPFMWPRASVARRATARWTVCRCRTRRRRSRWSLLDCHRNPGPNLRPESAIYNSEWTRTADTPSPQALLAHYGIPNRTLTDCSICHR